MRLRDSPASHVADHSESRYHQMMSGPQAAFFKQWRHGRDHSGRAACAVRMAFLVCVCGALIVYVSW